MSALHPSVGGARLRRMRFSAVQLLLALVLLFAAAPFLQGLPNGQFIEVLLMTVVLVSAVFAVGTRGRMLWIGGLLCAATLAARWSLHFFPQLLPVWVFPAAAIPFLTFVVTQILRFILRAPTVTAEVLCAAIAAYLLLGLVWAQCYLFIDQLAPDAFKFSAGPESDRKMDSFNASYFSFVVLSTLGFGDIIPVSRAARTLAVMESITGLFYVTVLIARLVTMYAPRAHTVTPDDSKNP